MPLFLRESAGCPKSKAAKPANVMYLDRPTSDARIDPNSNAAKVQVQVPLRRVADRSPARNPKFFPSDVFAAMTYSLDFALYRKAGVDARGRHFSHPDRLHHRSSSI